MVGENNWPLSNSLKHDDDEKAKQEGKMSWNVRSTPWGVWSHRINTLVYKSVKLSELSQP